MVNIKFDRATGLIIFQNYTFKFCGFGNKADRFS